jgi:hypothetical protein
VPNVAERGLPDAALSGNGGVSQMQADPLPDAASRLSNGPAAEDVAEFWEGLDSADRDQCGPILSSIADAAGSWKDDEVKAVIASAIARLKSDRGLTDVQVNRWLEHHRETPEVLSDLFKLTPPPEIIVIRRLSQIGSQKVVYDARWRGTMPVVLKRFVDPTASERLIERELQPHPFSMAHPHIIETHVLQNRDGERFLAEKKLSVVLSDPWSAGGAMEAANLLYDLATALQFLGSRGLVHGDIKPDNIGFDQGGYTLLDFGVCRQESDMINGSSATGSLRTRAPELLKGEQHSFASDVWALGATVFNSLAGAFPLFNPGEDVPRVSAPSEREKKEKDLVARLDDYESWVFDRLEKEVAHDGLRSLLRQMLSLDPNERITAGDLTHEARSKLVAFISSAGRRRDVSLDARLDQLDAYLPQDKLRDRLPLRRRIELEAVLAELEAADLDAEQRAVLRGLQSRLRPN